MVFEFKNNKHFEEFSEAAQFKLCKSITLNHFESEVDHFYWCFDSVFQIAELKVHVRFVEE